MAEYADDRYEEAVLEEYDEEKWHGVPPAGDTPIYSKGKFILGIVMVLLVEFTLWGIYRVSTAPLYGPGFNIPFFIGHMIAAPTIALLPIIGYWVFIRKEKIFKKTDQENGKFMSFNLGPFKLTRKRIATAVLVGLLGGVVWRISEMVIGNFSSALLGGSTFFSFHLMDIFAIDNMDWPTFLLMTFVMFFVVGPVEEFQFRSFAHDQSQRVLPKWAALVFSSIFFGLSHIPIAIFIYMPNYGLGVTDIIFMEISWMAAGATFGALYMWSRNIFACIVMHGIGNWQLSVFAIRNVPTESGLTGTNVYISDLFVSIFANGLMILLFFLIHKYYWQPQMRGEAAFGGRLIGLQKFLFSHDSGSRNGKVTGAGLTGVTIIVLVLIFGTTSALGFKSYDVLTVTEGDQEPSGEFDLEQYNSINENVIDSMYLDEGGSQNYFLNSSSKNVIQRVRITVQWTDEAEPPASRIRPYENQPDTFNVSIEGENLSTSSSKSNPMGGSGTITLDADLDNNYLNEVMGQFNITVTVEMQDAGMWVPSIGPGIIGLSDSGNEYNIKIELSRLQSSDFREIEEEEELPEDGEEQTGSPSLISMDRWKKWPIMR